MPFPWEMDWSSVNKGAVKPSTPWEVYKAELSGEPSDMDREMDQASFKFTLGDAAKKGILSKEGRDAFKKSVEQEWKSGKEGLNSKQLDKYYSDSWFFMRDKYPDEHKMLMMLDGPMKDLTKRQMTAIGSDTPFSIGRVSGDGTSGYVYHGDGADRAFLTNLGDAGTAVHEKEHLTTQRKVGDIKSLGITGRLDEPIPAMVNDLVLKKGKEFVNKDPVLSKVFRASNSFSSNNEVLSNIAQYEASLPDGKSIYDSDFNAKLIELYGKDKAKAILDQAVAYTLTDKGRISEHDKKFMGKVDSNQSYAKQLYQYLKNRFGE